MGGRIWQPPMLCIINRLRGTRYELHQGITGDTDTAPNVDALDAVILDELVRGITADPKDRGQFSHCQKHGKIF